MVREVSGGTVIDAHPFQEQSRRSYGRSVDAQRSHIGSPPGFLRGKRLVGFHDDPEEVDIIKDEELLPLYDTSDDMIAPLSMVTTRRTGGVGAALLPQIPSKVTVSALDADVVELVDSHGSLHSPPNLLKSTLKTSRVPFASGHADAATILRAPHGDYHVRLVLEVVSDGPQVDAHLKQRTLSFLPLVSIGRPGTPDETPQPTNGIFSNPLMSRYHAVLKYSKRRQVLTLRDMGSSNGTFLNGQRLSAEGCESDPVPVKVGDELAFGEDLSDGGTIYPRVVLKIRRLDIITGSVGCQVKKELERTTSASISHHAKDPASSSSLASQSSNHPSLAPAPAISAAPVSKRAVTATTTSPSTGSASAAYESISARLSRLTAKANEVLHQQSPPKVDVGASSSSSQPSASPKIRDAYSGQLQAAYLSTSSSSRKSGLSLGDRNTMESNSLPQGFKNEEGLYQATRFSPPAQPVESLSTQYRDGFVDSRLSISPKLANDKAPKAKQSIPSAEVATNSLSPSFIKSILSSSSSVSKQSSPTRDAAVSCETNHVAEYQDRGIDTTDLSQSPHVGPLRYSPRQPHSQSPSSRLSSASLLDRPSSSVSDLGMCNRAGESLAAGKTSSQASERTGSYVQSAYVLIAHVLLGMFLQWLMSQFFAGAFLHPSPSRGF